MARCQDMFLALLASLLINVSNAAITFNGPISSSTVVQGQDHTVQWTLSPGDNPSQALTPVLNSATQPQFIWNGITLHTGDETWMFLIGPNIAVGSWSLWLYNSTVLPPNDPYAASPTFNVVAPGSTSTTKTSSSLSVTPTSTSTGASSTSSVITTSLATVSSPSSTPSLPPPLTSPKKPSNIGAIVGGVVGGLAVVSIISWFVIRQRRREPARTISSGNNAHGSAVYHSAYTGKGDTNMLTYDPNDPTQSPIRLYNPADPSTYPHPLAPPSLDPNMGYRGIAEPIE